MLIFLVALLSFTPTAILAIPNADLAYGEDQATGNTSIVDIYGIGDKFTIVVKIENATELMGASIGAAWDPSVLECDLAGPNSGVSGSPYLQNGPPPGGTLLFLPGVINNSTGTISPYGWTRTAGGELAGSGILAYIDFEVVAYGSTWINLTVVLANSGGDENSPTIQNVWFENNPPPPPPAQNFLINIGTQDPVNSVGQPPYYIFNNTLVNYAIGIDRMAYDNISDTYYRADFYEFTFHSIDGMYTVSFNVTTPSASYLYDSYLGESTITVRAIALGMLTNFPSLAWSNTVSRSNWIVLPPSGAIIDVFTEEERAYGYMTPYIGEGPDMCADAYTLDEEVSLFANVTYNGGELQSRLVAWEVYDAQGNIVLTRTTQTNENGTAALDFRILTVCMNASYAVGTWWVIAKTSVGEVTINDTLCFKVYYTVAPRNTGIGSPMVILDTPTIGRGGLAHGDILLENWASTARNFTAAITIYDELGVPVGYYSATMVIPGAPAPGDPEYCNQFTLKRRPWFIEIPKWAYVGTGTVFINVYTKPVADCGVAWAPEASTSIIIEA
jgi:hypothetical protein